MQQYSTKLVNNFPNDASRRAVMQQRCDAITDPSIPKDFLPGANKRDTIEGFVYASGTYTSPNQSVLAYIICSPFLDSVKTENRFGKEFNEITKTKKRSEINPLIDERLCPISTAGNDLNDCNVMDSVHKITLIVLNDLTNIRHGTARGYVSINTGNIGNMMAQHFILGSGNTSADRILNANKQLCKGSEIGGGISYFGTGTSEQCGFSHTHALILNNAKVGKEILNKTTTINGEKLLGYECDSTDSGANLIGCGINDHSSTQSYTSMIYNELRFYQQFLAMYESISSLKTTFLVGKQIGLGRQGQDQLLNQIRINRQHQSKLISHATQVSINLISQFESAYPLHIGLLAADEASATAVTKYIQPRQNSIKFRMVDRLNTQLKDDTAKGTTS